VVPPDYAIPDRTHEEDRRSLRNHRGLILNDLELTLYHSLGKLPSPSPPTISSDEPLNQVRHKREAPTWIEIRINGDVVLASRWLANRTDSVTSV
jgi:hypothetical protein